MEKECKELMRVTNILCRKIFEFCKRKNFPQRKSASAAITLIINEIIYFMEQTNH